MMLSREPSKIKTWYNKTAPPWRLELIVPLHFFYIILILYPSIRAQRHLVWSIFFVAAPSSLSHSRSNSPLPYARRRKVDLLEFWRCARKRCMKRFQCQRMLRVMDFSAVRAVKCFSIANIYRQREVQFLICFLKVCAIHSPFGRRSVKKTELQNFINCSTRNSFYRKHFPVFINTFFFIRHLSSPTLLVGCLVHALTELWRCALCTKKSLHFWFLILPCVVDSDSLS